LETRQRFDPKSGKLVRQWSELVRPGTPSRKQGQETLYYPSGAKEWQREFKDGKPFGWWRRWYENGRLHSECFYSDVPSETTMTFWYADGKVQMQGPAVNGVRQGRWRAYHPSGLLAEEGEFQGSQREGKWLFYSEDGQVVTEVFYA